MNKNISINELKENETNETLVTLETSERYITFVMLLSKTIYVVLTNLYSLKR